MSQSVTSRFGVRILPREVILDTQGRAVEDTLKRLAMPVDKCRVGKYIELEFMEAPETARAKAETIAKSVLHNPLIETFKIEELK